jgi:heterodisulfide reductase subunit C2
MPIVLEKNDTGFLHEVERRSSTPVSACLQCHKCSTGCPVSPEADFMSSQVMRLIGLGEEKQVLESQAIWLCASCETCTTRCPMEIDVAGVMDVLRMLAVEKKASAPDTRGRIFNEAFLSSVRSHSRVFELGLMTRYKLRSGDLFADVGKVPKMLLKQKLSLLPHFSGKRKEVQRVFERALEEDKNR